MSRNDIDAIAVVIESGLVEQRGADGVGRMQHTAERRVAEAGADGGNVVASFGNPSYSGVIHATYAISPTLLNETAFNYNGNRINIVPIGLFTAPTGTNGFTFNRLFPGPNNNSRIPNIHLSGSTGTNYDIASWPWHNKADDYQIRDDISLTRGA